ncbi:MAG: hypothetical protein ACE149_11985 [Armatimonadota bacterium]
MPRGLRPKPSDLAAQMQVQVVFSEMPPPAQPTLRSEYAASPPRITVYTDPISSLGVAIHANQRFDMMRCDLVELHIAHELFHHVESGQRFGPLYPEEIEAAAHSFAKELLGADFEPQELDELLG